jgi:prephenate dehydrogenase
MGGSLAMALRGSVGKLTGIDRDAESCRLAVARGLVDDAAPLLNEGVNSADLVILAVPVRSIVKVLSDLPAMRPDGCMVLDLGSTKTEIEQAMEIRCAAENALDWTRQHPTCMRDRPSFCARTGELPPR